MSSENNGRWQTWHAKVGVPLCLTGVAILAVPGIKDALLRLADKWFGLGMKFDAPTWLGLLLVGLGLLTLFWGDLLACLSKPARSFVALRHHSVDSDAARLSPEHLGEEYRDYKIVEIDADESSFLTRGVCDPAGAVRHLLTKIADLKSARKLDGDVPIGYYGLAHVGLQFAAGFELASQSRVLLFDQERQNGAWHELTPTARDLDLTLTPVEQPPTPKAVAVRVAISYEIPREDVLEVLDAGIEDYRFALNTPRIDAISSYTQVKQVAERFRKLLDDLHARHNNNIPVHVFYAGPACLGFSLGRQINKNIHHPLWIHQYDGTFKPRYRWALELTSVSSGAQPTIKLQDARKA